MMNLLSLNERVTYFVPVYDGVLVDVDPARRRRIRREDLGSGQTVVAVGVTVGNHSGRVAVGGSAESLDSGGS